MGMYTPPQNNNFFGNLGNAFKNVFAPKNAGRNTQGGGAQFYQVKPTDNSMADVAMNLGHPLPDLISANQGIKTLPTPGSYIQLPTPEQGLKIPGVMAPGQNTFNNPHMGIVSPNLTQPNAGYQKADYAGTIQTQIESGSLPATIPQNLQGQLTGSAGQPLSNQDLQNAGYVFDPKTATWKLSGSGAGQPTGGGGSFGNTAAAQYNQANNVAFVNQLRWDPSRHKYVKIGQLLKEGKINIHSKNGKWYGKHGGGGGGQVAQVPATPQTIGTANTVLSLHLGGE